MTPNEYQKLASRTAVTHRMPQFTLEDMSLIHATVGLSSEVGKLCDAIKRYYFENKASRLDRENILEEAGDVLWYLSFILSSQNMTLEDAMTVNIAKLEKRHPKTLPEVKPATREGVEL